MPFSISYPVSLVLYIGGMESMRKPLFSRQDNLLVLMLVLSMILFASCGEEAAEKNKLNEKDYR